MGNNNLFKAAKLLFIAVLMGVISFQGKAQPTKVKFMARDKVPITADVYAPHQASAPLILLFHQAKYSRGEFHEIAPKLNSLGFNCIAVDLRSGGEVQGVQNETWSYTDSLDIKNRFTDAYTDMQAAVSYAKKTYPSAKLILLGSSYSSSLAIKMASDYPSGIVGVLAFSPGEYFSKYGWNNKIIQISASRIKCPVFITSAKEEHETWTAIYDAIPHKGKVKYIPEVEGKHGAKALWSVFPEHTGYWSAMEAFLKQYK